MKPKVSLQDVWKLVIRVVEMVMAHVKPIVNEDQKYSSEYLTIQISWSDDFGL